MAHPVPAVPVKPAETGLAAPAGTTRDLEFATPAAMPRDVDPAAPADASGSEATSGAERTIRRRNVVNTKLRTLLAKAAVPGAVLDDSERARLVTHHRVRLGLTRKLIGEFLAKGELRLISSDPGEATVIADVVQRADIYRAAAARLDERSTLADVVHVRRLRHQVRPPKMERPPVNALAAARRFMSWDPTLAEYTRLVCGDELARALIVEQKALFGGGRRDVQSYEGATAEALLDKAPEDLAEYLRRRGFGVIRPVPEKDAAQLLACRDATLFGVGLLMLDLMLRRFDSRHTYHWMLAVKQTGNCIDGDDLTTVDGMDRFANEYCLDRTRYPKDPQTRRTQVGRFLLDAHVDIDREIRAADPADVAMLMRYRLALPRMPKEFADRIAAEYRKVGSSRVDLQACKLEYSIVSPK